MTTINNSIGGPKTPTPGPSTAVSGTGTTRITVARSKSEREKKIGHRRVTQGGDVTYKKIQTSQIMGSIQLGIQHAIGGLASKPERDLLMQVSPFTRVENCKMTEDINELLLLVQGLYDCRTNIFSFRWVDVNSCSSL